MTHDFKAQERETYETFITLKKEGATLPARSVVEFYLLAEDENPNWAGCAQALHKAGYKTEIDQANDTLIVTTKVPIDITPERLWPEEKQITTIGLDYDFSPDGWEFGFDDA